MIVVFIFDYWTGEHAVLIGLLILGPLVASLRSNVSQSIGITALAIIGGIALGRPDGIWLTSDHLVRVSVLGLASLLCVRVTYERARRDEAMRRLSRVAEVAQTAILRPPPATLGNVSLAARYVSASEESLVGGDLYETAYTPFGVRVIIGDVRGKGLDAVQLAATVLGTFREVVWDRTLEEVARTLDERVRAEADEEEFVTVLLVEIPPRPGLRLVNCGHHPPLRLAEGGAEFLETPDATVPLGMQPSPQVDEHSFEPGDRLLLYTDGLIEARDRQGAFFDLIAHVDSLRASTPQAAVDGLLRRLDAHRPGRSADDVAVFLIERRAESQWLQAASSG